MTFNRNIVGIMRSSMMCIADDAVGEYWSCEYITPDPVYDPMLINIQDIFRRTQKSNYETSGVISLINVVKQTVEQLDKAKINTFKSYVNRSCLRAFIKEIYNRIDKSEKKRTERETQISRKLNHAIGAFEDTISPRMIQALACWYNSKVPWSERIYSGKKELIIKQFEEKGVKITRAFLNDFIDELKDPTKFTKEWGVSTHEHGKRKTNIKIRETMKHNIERRRLKYTKQPYIYASIRGMPLNVEELISEFL